MIKKPYLTERQLKKLYRKLPPGARPAPPPPPRRCGLVTLRERMHQPFEEKFDQWARTEKAFRVIQAVADAPITDPVEAVFFPVGKDVFGDAAEATGLIKGLTTKHLETARRAFEAPPIQSLAPEHLETARRAFEAPPPVAVPPKVWMLQCQGPEALKDYGWREPVLPPAAEAPLDPVSAAMAKALATISADGEETMLSALSEPLFPSLLGVGVADTLRAGEELAKHLPKPDLNAIRIVDGMLTKDAKGTKESK